MDGHRTASQKASLAGVLNPDENRDSAYFSSTDASSKHTSAASGLAVGVLSPTGSGYHSSPNDKTPSPTVVSSVPQTVISPSQSNMSVAAMVSPTTPGSADPRRQERPTSIESGPPSATLEPNLHAVSRRESVDSRMNQGFSDMRLGASSPYASHNQSTASIQNTLLQQRNPRPGFNDFAGHRISNGYQPSADRDPHANRAVRTAPTITGPATSQIARAAEPTKGQAWAFPEDEAPGQRTAAQNSLLDSRRSSIAESIASSQFTYESRLPTGQRHLEDDYGRASGASTEFPPVHHHSLQHKQLGDLMDEDAASRTGAQPYSRTPELRKSHKLAERKRRTEMKELFDQLRDLMPQERGSKASKWEILTKAISEHERLQGAFRHLQNQHISLSNENEKLRRDYQNLLYQTRGAQPQQAPAAPPPPAGAYPPSDPYVHRTELPPLRTLNGGAPNGPESMTGVQYEPPQANGYRPVDRY